MRAGKPENNRRARRKKIIENNKMHSGTHRMSLWPETESENNVWHTIESSAHYLFCVALFKWCLIKWFVAGAWPVDRFSWLVWLVCLCASDGWSFEIGSKRSLYWLERRMDMAKVSVRIIALLYFSKTQHISYSFIGIPSGSRVMYFVCSSDPIDHSNITRTF